MAVNGHSREPESGLLSMPRKGDGCGATISWGENSSAENGGKVEAAPPIIDIGAPLEYQRQSDCGNHYRTTERLREEPQECGSPAQSTQLGQVSEGPREADQAEEGCLASQFSGPKRARSDSLQQLVAQDERSTSYGTMMRLTPGDQGSCRASQCQSAQSSDATDDYRLQEDEVRDPLAHRLRSLVGGFLLHMVFGSQYVWGNISVYCLSHFYLMDHKGDGDHSREAGLSQYKNVVSLGLPLIVVSSMTAMPMGSQILKRLSKSRIGQIVPAEKLQIMIACTVCVLGTFLATSEWLQSFADDGHSRLMLFTITFAVSFGIANGLGYTMPLKICWDLFPNQKGMVTGVIICGFGVGSFVFGIISTILINPANQQTEWVDHNLVYGPQVANNAMPALRTLAVCWSALGCLALLLIKVKQEEPTENESAQNKNDDPDLQVADLLTDRRYWLLYLMNFCTVFYGYVLISSYKMFGSLYINDDLFLTFVGSIGCVCGSLRFLWSILLDLNFTYQQVYGTLCALQLVCASLIFHAASHGHRYLFLILMAVSMFCEGGHFVLLPSHCAQLFGSSKRGVQAFSMLFSCFGLSSLSGSLLSGYLQERECDPYKKMFGLSAFLTLAAMVTLAYYDKLLKGEATGSQSRDDEFQRVASQSQTAADPDTIRKRQLIERKNILADAMNGATPNLKRSASNNALASGFSDSDSQYSRTTRNTLQTNAFASSGPNTFQSFSNVRRREPQPTAFSKARHLDSVDDDSSGHGDDESDPAQSSFFASPLKESERDESMQKYFILKYA